MYDTEFIHIDLREDPVKPREKIVEIQLEIEDRDETSGKS